MKKEKEKEPEKAEKQETSMLRKKGFEEEKKDSDDSDEVWILFTDRGKSTFCLFNFLTDRPLILLPLYEQEIRTDGPKLSKKKLRRMNRLTVAELKQVKTKKTLFLLQRTLAKQGNVV